jgi:hypothetical protein
MPRTEDGKFKTAIHGGHPHIDEAHELASKFAWIPTVFAVSEDGHKVAIDGYINGLGNRAQHPVLFELLEQTFLLVMPLLEKTSSHEFIAREDTSSRQSISLYHRLVADPACLLDQMLDGMHAPNGPIMGRKSQLGSAGTRSYPSSGNRRRKRTLGRRSLRHGRRKRRRRSG